MARKLSDLIYVCKVASPHGVHGAFKIHLLSEDEERLSKLKRAYLVHPQDATQRLETIVSLQNYSNKAHILTCDRIHSPEEGRQYQGWFLAVDRSQARELPPGEYFICDLIGCEVYDQKHGYLGKVKTIQDLGYQSVYTVEEKGQKPIYFPAVESIIQHTDIQKGRIDVELPQGLYEVYR